MRHSVHRFIDGAVAAGDQNQFRAASHLLARDLARMPGASGGNGIERHPARPQHLDGPAQRMASPSESACVRIVNENGSPVNSTLIIVDAR